MMDKDKNKFIPINKKDKFSIFFVALCGILLILCIVGFVLWLSDGEYKEQGGLLLEYSGIFFVSLLIPGIRFINQRKTRKDAHEKKFWEDLVSVVLDDVFDSAAYNHDSGFSGQYIVDMDLLGLPVYVLNDFAKNFSSCNYLHAKYKGISFKHIDMKITPSIRGGYGSVINDRMHPSPLFHGRILEMDFQVYCPARLKIYSRNFTDVKLELFPSKSGKIQRTGNDHFDNEFQIRCDSEEAFRNMITLEMIEKLELYHNIYDQFAMEFYKDKLYVALDMKSLWHSYTGMERESFDPDYSKGEDYQSQIKKIKQDTKFITDTIDIFCRDLK